jgi:hypothetical protein
MSFHKKSVHLRTLFAWYHLSYEVYSTSSLDYELYEVRRHIAMETRKWYLSHSTRNFTPSVSSLESCNGRLVFVFVNNILIQMDLFVNYRTSLSSGKLMILRKLVLPIPVGVPPLTRIVSFGLRPNSLAFTIAMTSISSMKSGIFSTGTYTE